VRRILAVGHDNAGSALIFKKLLAAYPDIDFALAVTDGLYYRKSTIASLWKLLTEASWTFCAARAIDMLAHRIKGPSLATLAGNRLTFNTRDINDAASRAKIEAFAPDLIASLYTMHIYRPETLALAPLGGITAHPSILPNYRGLEVFFWAMANDEKTIGVSVFTLGDKVDHGRVLNETELPLDSKSMAEVYTIITETAAELIIKSIADLRKGTATYRIPEGEGSYYPMPTRAAVAKFRRLGKTFL
jgi:methionyl-tRNA formyltransferase